jgi:hypothetical protein
MDTPPPLRKQSFFLCLLFNLCALPGLGTWMAGKKTLGMIQLSISAFAMAVTALPVVGIYWSLAHQGLFRNLASGKPFLDAISAVQFQIWEFGGLLLALGGVCLFAANWAWSAFTAQSKPLLP